MAFTNAEKDDIRRYCGFYVFGSQPIQTFGWRFTNQYGHLEFLMNNLTTNQEDITRNVFLTNLRLLEADIPAIRSNLDTKQAAVWYWNDNEIRDRMRLYTTWRKNLCGYLGVGYGPDLISGVSFTV